MGSTKVYFVKEVPNSVDPSENLQIKMFVVPTILITSPLFEHDDRFLPRITVTRDESDFEQNDVEENILNMEILDDGEMNLIGSTIGESRSIFPDSLFDAARSENATDRDKISGHVYQCHAGHVMCSPCR